MVWHPSVVRVHRFAIGHQPVEKIVRVDTSWIDRQKARIREVRATRFQKATAAALKHLEQMAKTNENTMPVFIECVEAYCTIGESRDVLRNQWGELRELVVV